MLLLAAIVACHHDTQPPAADASVTADAATDATVDAAIDAPTVDTTPPTLTSTDPSASRAWLHAPIRFTFDEPVHGGDAVAMLEGVVLTTTVQQAGPNTIEVVLAPSTIGLGALDVTLTGVRDAADNAAALAHLTATVAPWEQLAAPSTSDPAVAIAASGATYVATSGGVLAIGNDVEQPLACVVASAVAVDAMERPVAAWIDTGVVQAARWDGSTWAPLPSPGTGTSVRLARAPDGTIAALLVASATLTVMTLDNDAWTATGPAIAAPNNQAAMLALGAAATPSVAWLVPGQLHARVLAGNVWTTIAPLAISGTPRASLAARGAVVAVAWDEIAGSSSVYAAKLVGSAFQRLGGTLDLDVAGDAREPAIAIAANGAPIVAWNELVETQYRGVVAKWNGVAWALVGGRTFVEDPLVAPGRPALVLGPGDAPVIAARGAVARFDGPSAAAPTLTRGSIAGCSFSAASPPATVIASGCFTVPTAWHPVAHAGMVPFDVIVELWSDGAKKRRWIALPNGASMTASATGAWALPVGGFVVKEFAYETTPGNPATRHPVETRFLVMTASGLEGFTYKWRADGTNADLLTDNLWTFDWPLDNGGTYTHLHPTRAHCTSCHDHTWGPMLGVRPEQLARWIDDNGKFADQLPSLVALGVGPNSAPTPWKSPHDASLTFETRTRGYMGANCAHCHNPDHISVKDLRPTTALADTKLCQVIVPGNHASSNVWQRVTSRMASFGMPALGSLVPDPLVGSILGSWIDGMTSCP